MKKVIKKCLPDFSPMLEEYRSEIQGKFKHSQGFPWRFSGIGHCTLTTSTKPPKTLIEWVLKSLR